MIEYKMKVGRTLFFSIIFYRGYSDCPRDSYLLPKLCSEGPKCHMSANQPRDSVEEFFRGYASQVL